MKLTITKQITNKKIKQQIMSGVDDCRSNPVSEKTNGFKILKYYPQVTHHGGTTNTAPTILVLIVCCYQPLNYFQFLSYSYSFLATVFCNLGQVTWSGRCREGVGLSTGETTELANSYMSRLGVITRAMENTGLLKTELFMRMYTHKKNPIFVVELSGFPYNLHLVQCRDSHIEKKGGQVRLRSEAAKLSKSKFSDQSLVPSPQAPSRGFILTKLAKPK